MAFMASSAAYLPGTDTIARLAPPSLLIASAADLTLMSAPPSSATAAAPSADLFMSASSAATALSDCSCVSVSMPMSMSFAPAAATASPERRPAFVIMDLLCSVPIITDAFFTPSQALSSPENSISVMES